jgi:hypothetical protein
MKAKDDAQQLFLETTYFVDDDHFFNTLESYGSALPIGVHLISRVNRDRVVLLADSRKAGRTEFLLTRFGRRVERIELFSTQNELQARALTEEWTSLTTQQMTMAIYLAHSQRGKSPAELPVHARCWSKLNPTEQEVIWGFINADVPGGFLEILDVARACGCVKSHTF